MAESLSLKDKITTASSFFLSTEYIYTILENLTHITKAQHTCTKNTNS
jgi:hypothetical protein